MRHMLDYLLDYVLDHMIIDLVTMALYKKTCSLKRWHKKINRKTIFHNIW